MFNLKEDLLKEQNVGFQSVINDYQDEMEKLKDHLYLLSVLKIYKSLQGMIAKIEDPSVVKLMIFTEFIFEDEGIKIEIKFGDENYEEVPLYKIKFNDKFDSLTVDIAFFELDKSMPDFKALYLPIQNIAPLLEKFLPKHLLAQYHAAQLEMKLETKAETKRPKI